MQRATVIIKVRKLELKLLFQINLIVKHLKRPLCRCIVNVFLIVFRWIWWIGWTICGRCILNRNKPKPQMSCLRWNIPRFRGNHSFYLGFFFFFQRLWLPIFTVITILNNLKNVRYVFVTLCYNILPLNTSKCCCERVSNTKAEVMANLSFLTDVINFSIFCLFCKIMEMPLFYCCC